jgi:DNA replication protein DnaC
LTPEEREYMIDDLKDRPDDKRREVLVLRFLAKEMLRDPFGFLSIWGRKGGGKSVVLAALVAEFCRQKREAVYFNAGDIVTLLSPGEDKEIDGFRYVAGNPDANKRRLKEISVLAIDEIDKLTWSNWQIQQIGEVIEHRHRNAARLVTLIAMNKAPWEWNNATQVEHIASRLEDGRFCRQWPEGIRTIPSCLRPDPNNAGRYEAPGLFEVTLPDMRPMLRRSQDGAQRS